MAAYAKYQRQEQFANVKTHGAGSGSKVTARPRSASRQAAGTPAYKSQEEYYDEILNLKKEIKSLTEANKNLRAKLGRVEKDNLKKERDIEQLLDPGKSTEMRRTLADRKPDAGSVIHGLKQRILRLEQQLRDKESECSKIQSELKYTRVEELRIQLETAYSEIQRLSEQVSNSQSNEPRSSRSPRGEKLATRGGDKAKIQALNQVVLRINEEKKQLKEQNQKLMTDLDTQMAGQQSRGDQSQRRQHNMSALEKKLEASEQKVRELKSSLSQQQKAAAGQRDRSTEQVRQLEDRESQLLAELDKQKQRSRELHEQNKRLRREGESQANQLKALQQQLEKADRSPRQPSRRHADRTDTKRQADRTDIDQTDRTDTPPVAATRQRPTSSRSERELRQKAEALRQKNAAIQIQRGWRSHRHQQNHKAEVRQMEQRAADERKQRAEQRAADERKQRAEQLRQRNAATKIQRQWKDHTLDDATVSVQGAIRSHQGRKESLNRLQEEERLWTTQNSHQRDGDSEDGYVEDIQATFRGHTARQRQLRESVPPSSDGEYSDAVETVQAAFKGHRRRTNQLRDRTNLQEPVLQKSSFGLRRASVEQRRGSAGSGRGSYNTSTPPRQRTPSSVEEVDDDDDIMF